MNSPFKIVALGEILWDLFPNRSCFGGAPANFACAIGELGGENVDVHMFSGVGNDALGDKAIQELQSHHVGTELVQRLDKTTGQVEIELNPDGSARYQFAEDVAWDNLTTNPASISSIAVADAICFGTLGQRSSTSAKAIQDLVSRARPDCLRVLDINLRFPHVVQSTIIPSLDLCDVLKLNEEELPYLAKMFRLHGTTEELVRQISDNHNLLVALTLGEKGAVLQHGSNWIHHRHPPVKVVDTVGAGDAFTAALTLGLLRQQSENPEALKMDGLRLFAEIGRLKALLEWSNRVAAFVCSHPGASPKIPNALKAEVPSFLNESEM